jgi:hypothetical protein
MKDKLFNELLESIQEIDAIARGKKKPARTFHCNASDGIGIFPAFVQLVEQSRGK